MALSFAFARSLQRDSGRAVVGIIKKYKLSQLGYFNKVWPGREAGKAAKSV